MKRIIKILLLTLSSALILGGCGKLSVDLDELKDGLEAVNTDIKSLSARVESLKSDIALMQSSDNAQTETIKALEEEMSGISDELAKVKASVSALEFGDSSGELTDQIDDINSRLSAIDSEIASLFSLIEEMKDKTPSEVSVGLSYIPKYSDYAEYILYHRNVFEISHNEATLMFDVQPRSVADSIVKNWQSALAARAMYAHTKPVDKAFVCLDITGASAQDGVLSVTVSVDNLGNDFIFDNGASVAIKVNSEQFNGLSDYIKLSPDFKNAEEKALISYLLKNFDADGDGQPDDMDKVTELDVSGFGVSNINDIIAEMPALKILNCSNNNLTSIDLSRNTALETLNISNNSFLATLDVSNNSFLATLDVSNNSSLATLDVSNTSLTTLDVNGLNISSLKITGTMSTLIGQYVVCNGVKGVIFYATGTVKVVSTDETSTTWDYYGTTSTGATSSDDGVANTDKIVSGSSAAKWCRAKGSEWYLPALNELKVIYNNKSTLNATLSSIGGTQFGTSYYWSSTEYDSSHAYNVDFSSGSSDSINKGNSTRVRAVRAL